MPLNKSFAVMIALLILYHKLTHGFFEGTYRSRTQPAIDILAASRLGQM